jgi:hypothetical protein
LKRLTREFFITILDRDENSSFPWNYYATIFVFFVFSLWHKAIKIKMHAMQIFIYIFTWIKKFIMKKSFRKKSLDEIEVFYERDSFLWKWFFCFFECFCFFDWLIKKRKLSIIKKTNARVFHNDIGSRWKLFFPRNYHATILYFFRFFVMT